MVFHMKTTLNIDDGVMNRLKEEAARRGTTMSSLVEAGIRLVLEGPGARSRPPLPPMPTFHGGEPSTWPTGVRRRHERPGLASFPVSSRRDRRTFIRPVV